jgi:hypothetical protein
MTRQFEFMRDEIKNINGQTEMIEKSIAQLCDMFGIKAEIASEPVIEE